MSRFAARIFCCSTLAVLLLVLVWYIVAYGVDVPVVFPKPQPQDVMRRPISHPPKSDQKWYTKPFDEYSKRELKPMHYCMADGKRAWMVRFEYYHIGNCEGAVEADINGVAKNPDFCWCESYQNDIGYCEKTLALWIFEDEECRNLLADFNAEKEKAEKEMKQPWWTGPLKLFLPNSDQDQHYFTVSHHTDFLWTHILRNGAYDKEIQLLSQAELIPERKCRAGTHKRDWSTIVYLGWPIEYKWSKCNEVEAYVHGKLVKPDSCECVDLDYLNCREMKLHWLIGDRWCS
ncbi:hypothetical protein GALMADRAFT_243506 [Galerina marginata CBS 339.88]|uniref:Uncharacterized protein n=1 Tax=Galerina marginata (strain CBS 339.88) TaxID=685588 RepID=A0A067TAS0_GALM3|nr:hypothetical protein GALMADRAFT_243506 [Galerina marginata CBS 339.88]